MLEVQAGEVLSNVHLSLSIMAGSILYKVRYLGSFYFVYLNSPTFKNIVQGVPSVFVRSLMNVLGYCGWWESQGISGFYFFFLHYNISLANFDVSFHSIILP